jgi:selenocysteine lyase/cysteine desulfurase
VEFVLKIGIVKIHTREMALTERLTQGLKQIPRVILYGPQEAKKQIATLSFNIQDVSPSEVGLLLDERFGILCRVGLHCAPSAHKTIGTFPEGTVRFGLSYFNTEEEIDLTVQAVRSIAGGGP